jgi:hypothetical protein
MAHSQTDLQDMLYFWLVNCGETFPTIKVDDPNFDKKLLNGRPGTATKIDHAYDGNGGWELWAQVEIATLIASKYSASHKVTREERIYDGTNQATDLVIRDPHDKILQIIELKCERKSMSGGIVAAVQDDVIKLKKTLKSAYSAAGCFAVGISCTDNGATAILRKESWPKYHVHSTPCGKTPLGRPITLVWVDLAEVDGKLL